MGDCKLIEFNLRSASHADGANIRIQNEDGEISYLWMSASDARKNIKEGFCDKAEMRKALAAYKHDWEAAGLVQHPEFPQLYIRKPKQEEARSEK